MKGKTERRKRLGRAGLCDFDIPPEADPEKTPALLKYWYLGSRARGYMTRRRVAAVVGLLEGVRPCKVLDVGCGWGLTPAVLARVGFRAVGIDLSDDGFRAACRIREANGVRFNLVGGDAARLPFRDGAFKAATAVEVLEHVYEPDRGCAYAELYRVLASGGILALSTPNYGSLVEFGKRIIVKVKPLKRLMPYIHYPSHEVLRDDYHPFEYHMPVRRGHLKAMLWKAGFTFVRDKRFLFVLKYTPDRLFRPARFLEAILEKIPLIRDLAATNLVLAVKPSPVAPRRRAEMAGENTSWDGRPLDWRNKSTDRFVLRWIKRYLSAPVSVLLNRVPGVRPWTATAASALAGAAAGAILALGYAWQAGVVAAAAQILDGVDGQLARLKGISSPGGAFLDSVLDRVTDGALVLGTIIYLVRRPPPFPYYFPAVVALGFVAVVASGLVSYSAARVGELGLKLPAKPTLASKGTRVTVIVLCALATALWEYALLAGLLYLAIHPTAAVVKRILTVSRSDRIERPRKRD
jgi:CDP-diacylglycerol--glycerol-3-phosphate 3-phosphatidyltransferase